MNKIRILEENISQHLKIKIWEKMNYHITKSKDLVSIYKEGLKHIVGNNSEKVNDLRRKQNPKQNTENYYK